MPHIILDVNFPTHPKVLRVPPLAQLLHIRAMLYCCQHMTDGWFQRSILGMLGFDLGDFQAHAKQLVEAKLWHEHADVIEINDYLEFQFSKQEIEAHRARKRANGEAGGKASAQARAQARAGAGGLAGDGKGEDNESTTGQATGQASAQATACPVGSPEDEQQPKQKATPISDVRYPISDVRSPMSDDRCPIPDVPKRKKKSCSGDPAAPPKSDATFTAYSEAYQRRWGVVPVRNATVNALLCRLVDKLGAEEAPPVAAFYVTHSSPFYVQRRHPVEILFRDAEGLRTQWATGQKSTTREARSAEQRDNVNEQVRRVRAQVQGGA